MSTDEPLSEFIGFVAPGLRTTEKHGSHNQADHAGGRSGGRGLSAAEEGERRAALDVMDREERVRGGSRSAAHRAASAVVDRTARKIDDARPKPATPKKTKPQYDGSTSPNLPKGRLSKLSKPDLRAARQRALKRMDHLESKRDTQSDEYRRMADFIDATATVLEGRE